MGKLIGDFSFFVGKLTTLFYLDFVFFFQMQNDDFLCKGKSCFSRHFILAENDWFGN